MSSVTSPVLVGDVGGTHARFGLWHAGALVETTSWPTASVPTLSACVAVLRARWRFDRLAVAVAGPVQGRRAALTNAGWTADLDDVGVDGLLLNDLEAAAWGCGAGQPRDCVQLAGEPPRADGDAALIGVGTGLGQALWLHPARAVAGEGGHGIFAPRDGAEHALAQAVAASLGRPAEWEDLVSGSGLGRLAQHLAVRERDVVHADPVLAGRWVVAEQATAPTARAAAQLFWVLLASEVRNAALRTLPARGVYIVGGLAPRLRPSFDAAAFGAAVVGAGPLAWRLEGMPVTLVCDDDLALRGAAAAAGA